MCSLHVTILCLNIDAVYHDYAVFIKFICDWLTKGVIINCPRGGSNSQIPKMQSWPHPSTKNCKHSPSPQIKNATMAPCSIPKCNHGPLIRKELRCIVLWFLLIQTYVYLKMIMNHIHSMPSIYYHVCVHRVLGVGHYQEGGSGVWPPWENFDN